MNLPQTRQIRPPQTITMGEEKRIGGCLPRAVCSEKLHSAAGDRGLRGRSLITLSSLGRIDAREAQAAACTRHHQ
jgi:hypothetical protein